MSAWKDILDAVNTLVSAVSSVPTVTVLKSPMALPSTVVNTLPACIICPLGEEEAIDYATEKQTLYRYPVGIFLVYSHNRSFTITATMPDMRESIRQALDKRPPLSNLAAMDVELRAIPLYTHTDNPETVVDVSGWIAVYEHWETRTNA